jgi:hypothetical protein
MLRHLKDHQQPYLPALRQKVPRAASPIPAVRPAGPSAPVDEADDPPHIHWLTIDPGVPGLIPGPSVRDEPGPLGDVLFCATSSAASWSTTAFLRAGERETVDAMCRNTARRTSARHRCRTNLSRRPLGAAPLSTLRPPELPAPSRLKPVLPLRDLFLRTKSANSARHPASRDVPRRRPFPGPGLAVRCLGRITRLRPDTLRATDRIVNQEIQDADLPQAIFQSFAVLLPVGSVTGTGGPSGAGETICLRIAEYDDGATVDWVPLPAALLGTIGARLTAKVPGISRVVYGITPKPPGRIEWE